MNTNPHPNRKGISKNRAAAESALRTLAAQYFAILGGQGVDAEICQADSRTLEFRRVELLDDVDARNSKQT